MKQKILYGLLALAVSFGLWLYVITVENPASETTFYNIPVVLDNESVLADRGLMVLGDKTPTVTLKLSGNRSHLNKLNSSNITLVADLSRIYDSGEQAISYTISYPGDIPQNSIDVLSQLPAQIGLTIVERDSKEVPVNVVTIGKAADGYAHIKDKMVLSHSTIRVAGPASLIGAIAEARITIDIEGRNEHIDQSFRYTFYDKSGNPVTDSSLTGNVPEIKVSLLIQQVKEIPVVFNPIYGGGTTASNTTIKSSVNNIEVAGREEQLSRLDEINLGDIDLGAIEVNNNVLTYELTDYLPDGVTVVSGEEQITVTITFPELASKSVTVTQFRYKNLPEGMSAEFVTKQMSVVVRGKEYELKWLTDSNVVVWVDLANAKLGMDDYSATFEIVKNSDSKDFETLGVMTCTQKVTVRLTEAPAA
jgi:YbbR domain-containing protein